MEEQKADLQNSTYLCKIEIYSVDGKVVLVIPYFNRSHAQRTSH
jgi:hypothetical protein